MNFTKYLSFSTFTKKMSSPALTCECVGGGGGGRKMDKECRRERGRIEWEVVGREGE